MTVLRTILSARANIVGTILIAAGSSLLTTFSIDGQLWNTQSAPPALLPAVSSSSVLECGERLYSPVQRKCVSKQIFDDEMKRLFAALGINASIYASDDREN